MRAYYKSKWTKELTGKNDEESTSIQLSHMKEWAETLELNAITQAHLEFGLKYMKTQKQLDKNSEDWPPTPAEFVSYCKIYKPSMAAVSSGRKSSRDEMIRAWTHSANHFRQMIADFENTRISDATLQDLRARLRAAHEELEKLGVKVG